MASSISLMALSKASTALTRCPPKSRAALLRWVLPSTKFLLAAFNSGNSAMALPKQNAAITNAQIAAVFRVVFIGSVWLIKCSIDSAYLQEFKLKPLHYPFTHLPIFPDETRYLAKYRN